MTTIDLAALATVTGGAEQQPGWGSRAWQATKDVSGGFVAGATTGLREDQPWGNSSSSASKLGGELGVMSTLGIGGGRMRVPRR